MGSPNIRTVTGVQESDVFDVAIGQAKITYRSLSPQQILTLLSMIIDCGRYVFRDLNNFFTPLNELFADERIMYRGITQILCARRVFEKAFDRQSIKPNELCHKIAEGMEGEQEIHFLLLTRNGGLIHCTETYADVSWYYHMVKHLSIKSEEYRVVKFEFEHMDYLLEKRLDFIEKGYLKVGDVAALVDDFNKNLQETCKRRRQQLDQLTDIGGQLVNIQNRFSW